MLESVAYLLWQAGAVGCLGVSVFLWRAGAVPSSLLAWTTRVAHTLIAMTVLALVAGCVVLRGDALRIFGQLPSIDAPLWRVLLSDTRLGQVWIVKQLLLLSLALGLYGARHTLHRALLPCALLAALFVVVGVWGGHGGVSEPLALFVPVHGLHGVLSAAWLGALPVWASLLARAGARTQEHVYLSGALQRHSRLALGAMLILFLTGVLLVWSQFGSWPAVFATSAALWLWLKLGALGIVLGAAWRLRRTYLGRLAVDSGVAVRRAAQGVFALEAGAALVLFAAALELAHGTPGAHDEVRWWLPFRLLPALVSNDSYAQWQLTIALTGLACACPAWCLRYRKLGVSLLLLGSAVAFQALTVRAFPSTYTRPGVAYSAASIARGVTIYTQHCTGCHGSGGRGDGELALTTPVAPADLAQHTALHSAGDMFAWLSDGTPSGAMPGFRAVLDAEQRWDLINMLRALADGHRARVLQTTPVARRPWLAAPNFHYQCSDGTSDELKSWREQSAVLVIFADAARAPTRVQALSGDAATLHKLGLRILVVAPAQSCAALAPAATAFTCIVKGGDDAAIAYRLLSRTLHGSGPRSDLLPVAGDAEFLIDRYGYLRARWLPADAVPPWSIAQLRDIQQELSAEPRIRATPDLHVH